MPSSLPIAAFSASQANHFALESPRLVQVWIVIRSWLDKNARGLVLGLMMAMVFLYFVFMTLQGDRGVMALLRAQSDLRASEAALSATQATRAALEAKVKRLRPASIDPDLLDEQIRSQLNMVKPEEMIILTPALPETSTKPDLLQRSK